MIVPARKFLTLQLALLLTALLPNGTAARQAARDHSNSGTFFDVSELPARIEEPKLRKTVVGPVLDCEVANRSGEDLLGITLTLIVIANNGKIKSRLNWAETTNLAAYSIKSFTFLTGIKEELASTDHFVLGIDEVIGRYTIWQVADADNSLRAFALGQHDIAPKVRSVENKFDRPFDLTRIPVIRRR